MDHSKITKWVKIIGSTLSISLFVYLLAQLNWNTFLLHIKELTLLTMVLVFLLYTSGMVFNGLRWFSLLHSVNVNISVLSVLRLTFVGAFSSNFLPSTIGGDGIRFLGLLKYDQRKDICLSSIILDRVLNILLMLLILPLALCYFFPEFKKIFQLIQERNDRSIPQGFKYSQGSIFGVILPYLSSVLRKSVSIFRKYFQTPIPLVNALLATGAALLCSFYGTYLVAQKLDMAVKFSEVIAISAIVYFVTLIPISLNGIGIRELIMTTLYVSLGSTIEQATILALLTRILMILMTSVGFIWLPQLVATIDFDQIKLNRKFEGFYNKS